jgi:hypothetical protein
MIVRMPRRRFYACTLCAALASSLGPRLASAQDDATRAAARSLAFEGNDADKRGDAALAEAKFDKAFALVPVPTLGLSSARARVKQGKLVEAAERYRQVLRLDAAAVGIAGAGLNLPLQQRAQADAERELAALLPRIPRIVLTLVGAEAREVTVKLDEAWLPNALVGEPYPVNPGRHRLRAWRGTLHVERELTLDEAALEQVELTFAEAPAVAAPVPLRSPAVEPTAPITHTATPRSPRLEQSFGWSLVALGGVMLAVGGVSYLYWSDQKQEIEDQNGGIFACPTDAREPCDRYNAWRRLPPIASIAGGVLALTGGFLLVWSWESDRVELGVGLGPRAEVGWGLPRASPRLVLDGPSLELAPLAF